MKDYKELLYYSNLKGHSQNSLKYLIVILAVVSFPSPNSVEVRLWVMVDQTRQDQTKAAFSSLSEWVFLVPVMKIQDNIYKPNIPYIPN